MNKKTSYPQPKLEDLLNFHADSIMLVFNVHHFGTIKAFDSTTQTATATIDYSKISYVWNGQTGNYDTKASVYPEIIGAPVRFPHSLTNGGVTYPVAVNERCEIVFNDRDMDAWTFGQGNIQPNSTPQEPATARLHSLSDAVIVVGINPPASPIKNFDASRPMLRDGVGTSFVAINPSNGKIQLKNPSQNLETVLQSILTHLNSLATACASITVLPGTFSNSGGPVVGFSGTPVNASTFSTLASDLSTDATNLAQLLE